MTFKVFDTKYESRLYLLDDLEVQFRNHEAPVPPEVAYRMSRFNRDEFVIENIRVPFNPDSWKKDKRLIWSCNYASANGFGMVAENTVKGLLEQGIHVINPGSVSSNMVLGGDYVDEAVKTTLQTTITPDCLEIQHCQPPALCTGIVEKTWIYTMFETSHTPRSWIKKLNEVDRVLVPSQWLVESWQEQGVKRPISVYGHGIDESVYHYIDRPERETYTFLHLGQLSYRKGTDLVFRAFYEEFKGNNAVKLILKNTYPLFPVPLGVENVEYIHATYSKEQMMDLFARADCFVFPSRGEGFGLPPLEAMSTGLPTIMTNWSGMKDFADRNDTLLLDYALARSHEFDEIYKGSLEPGEDTGWWAEADMNQLREYMRWCYEHRAKAKAFGKKAARRTRGAWTWKAKTKELIELINNTC